MTVEHLRRGTSTMVACMLMAAISAMVPMPSGVAEGRSNQPTLTIAPDQVSCATRVDITGTGFIPGSDVVIAPAGIPMHVLAWRIGPITVATDGTFRFSLKPGIFIHACSGGPLGYGDTPFVLTASTALVGDRPFGEPSANASFDFVPFPTDPDLLLTPNSGGCESNVAAHGTNFVSGTTVTVFAKPLIGNAVTNHGTAMVAADGTFVLPLAHAFGCDVPDGMRLLVTARTGGDAKTGDVDGDVSASELFTVGATSEERFTHVWARTDRPVADQRISRTWMWGPAASTGLLSEQYLESPGGIRVVQYFDKSRMEINCPVALCSDPVDPNAEWYVTNGRLVVEMVEGWYAVGDDARVTAHGPAEVNIAGDANERPTYADINRLHLQNEPAEPAATMITATYTDDNTIGSDVALARYGVTAAQIVPETGHAVASVFFDFLNATGTIYQGGSYIEDQLFEPWFYASGYPITEAYWSRIVVGGVEQDVLWQCFERRCLTFTPGNPVGWQVEAGNVGAHYYRWRHDPSVDQPMAHASDGERQLNTANAGRPLVTPSQGSVSDSFVPLLMILGLALVIGEVRVARVPSVVGRGIAGAEHKRRSRHRVGVP